METYEVLKKKAIEENLVKYLGSDIDKQGRLAMSRLLEDVLDSLMKGERSVFLESGSENKGNGYYPRELTAGSWKLNIAVPRDRMGEFRPHILPEPYKRVDDSYVALLASMVVNGYSESQLAATLRRLGLPYSESELGKIREQLIDRLSDFKRRELPCEAFAVFIDGYHTDIKDDQKIRKACLYSVMGIDLDGRKDVYGYYTFFGNENKGDWLKVLNDLIERGLKKVVVVISDDFAGLGEAIKALYPLTEHQLCYVHLQRNVRRQMGKEDALEFNKELDDIKRSNDIDEGRELFNKLCGRYQKNYPGFIRSVAGKVEHYLCFLRYPEDIRKHLYTTNAVESLNSRIEQIRVKLGGYFQSTNILEVNLLLQVERLRQGKWKNPIPNLKSKAYEIQQLFNQKFCRETQPS